MIRATCLGCGIPAMPRGPYFPGFRSMPPVTGEAAFVCSRSPFRWQPIRVGDLRDPSIGAPDPTGCAEGSYLPFPETAARSARGVIHASPSRNLTQAMTLPKTARRSNLCISGTTLDPEEDRQAMMQRGEKWCLILIANPTTKKFVARQPLNLEHLHSYYAPHK